MSVTISIPNPQYIDSTQALLQIIGQLTLSGNYVNGGDPVNFGSLDVVKSRQQPIICLVQEQNGTPSGYVLQLVPTGPLTASLFVFTSNGASPSALAQLASGAYPASLLAATIGFTAVFPYGI
jgi:hypothetical protein